MGTTKNFVTLPSLSDAIRSSDSKRGENIKYLKQKNYK